MGMKVEVEKERSGRGLPCKCPNIHSWEILLEVPLTNVLIGVMQQICLENCDLLFATIYSPLPNPQVSFQFLPPWG